jgi:hypothetical protein
MNRFGRISGIAFSIAYLALWIVCVSFYFVSSSFTSYINLAFLTLPGSLAASEISHIGKDAFGLSADARVYVELIAFLLFGCIQYFLLGYLAGSSWGWIKGIGSRIK